MIIQYEILFEVNVRNEYYKDKYSPDFDIQPTGACQELLQRYKLVFRKSAYGFKVFAPVIPKTILPQLEFPLQGRSLRFTFEMISKNSYLDAISDIPDHHPAQEIFYFSNLYNDADNGLLYLGDQIAGDRIGEALKIINTTHLNYRLTAPVNAAQFELVDLFNNSFTLPVQGFSFSDPAEKTNLFQHELQKVEKMSPGRYLMSDNQGGDLTFYFDPSFYGRRVFGVIEIYSNTTELTPDQADHVPPAYRFVENDEISGKGNYNIGLPASQHKWMYVCRKNPENAGNGLEVKKLTVEGPVTFSKAGGDDIEERKILSNDPITSSEERVTVSLKHEGTKILDLPNPGLGSTIKKNNGDQFFEMYIYV